MIVDNIKNAKLYYSLIPDAEKVFEFLSGLTEQTATGRYDISDKVYVNVSRITTRKLADQIFESHGAYADLHFMICGEERIDTCDTAKMTTTVNNLNTPDDYALHTDAPYVSTGVLKKGDFLVTYPAEAHAPGVSINDNTMEILKAVVKFKA